MQELVKELTPVEYSDAGVKKLNFETKTNHRCFRLHWHDRMEIIKLNTGTMEIDVTEEKVILNPNEIYIIPPKVPHTAVAKSDVEYDVIMFDIRSFYNATRLSSKFLESVFNGNAKFDIKTDNIEILNCYNELINPNKSDGLLTVSLIYKIISLLFQNCLSEFSVDTRANTVISEAIKYMEERYAEDISTKSIAEKFGYSSAHFCRKFKEETWLTPMNYLKIYRLEQSAKLLKAGKYSVTEVATRCGFDDANYFTRCFKAHFGTAPVRFKER